MKIYNSDYKLTSYTDGCDYGWNGCSRNIKRMLAKVPSIRFVDIDNVDANSTDCLVFETALVDVSKVLEYFVQHTVIPLQWFKTIGNKAYFVFDFH